jgi:hypothetical protein
MMIIENYSNFVNLKKSKDIIDLYLNNDISENEFNEKFNYMLNEGIVDTVKDFYNKIKTNVLNVLLKIIDSVKKIKNIGVSFLKKVFNIIKKINNFIKKLKEKNPNLFYIIKIFIIFIIIVVISIVQARATNPVEVSYYVQNSEEVLSMSLGIIHDVKEMFGMGVEKQYGLGTGDFDYLLEAENYFKMVSDGADVVEITEKGNEVVNSIYKSAYNIWQSWLETSKKSDPGSFEFERSAKMVVDLMKKGSKIINN